MQTVVIGALFQVGGGAERHLHLPYSIIHIDVNFSNYCDVNQLFLLCNDRLAWYMLCSCVCPSKV